MRILLPFAILFLTACPDGVYPFKILNVTHYPVTRVGASRTRLGSYVVRQDAPVTQAFLDEIDRRTVALETCLKKNKVWDHINYNWINVYVPKDWYVSTCSGEQLVPSTPALKECRIKGLKIDDKCLGLPKPTTDCPCVCNHRAVVQNNGWIITAPNLKLYKAELARLVLAAQNPWTQPLVVQCLGE
ncbi:MAG: hypothetical protein WC505_05835 [Patescibacteria group bacterium]